MIVVFRDVLLSIADNEIGNLPTFDLMFTGIDSDLRSSVSTSIGLQKIILIINWQ